MPDRFDRASYGQFCPVAMAAEIVCSRWTALVLRELLSGTTRFNDLRRGVPLMSPSLLSKRLKELEETGVIVTVPAGFVDVIIHLLCKVRLADGMSLDEHHGYDPRTTPHVFGRFGFVLERHRRFQLGLNHLFVLRKPATVEAEGHEHEPRPAVVALPA